MTDEWRTAYDQLNKKYIQKCDEVRMLLSRIDLDAKSHQSHSGQLNDIIHGLQDKIKKCKCAEHK